MLTLDNSRAQSTRRYSITRGRGWLHTARAPAVIAIYKARVNFPGMNQQLGVYNLQSRNRFHRRVDERWTCQACGKGAARRIEEYSGRILEELHEGGKFAEKADCSVFNNSYYPPPRSQTSFHIPQGY
jgi:hypothetical protein